MDFIRKQLEPDDLDEFNAMDWDALRGAIIGETTIVDEIGTGHIRMTPPSRWYFGPCAFLVEEGVLYDKPIPCRGRLGFFKPEILKG
jgi:hypothetical protein